MVMNYSHVIIYLLFVFILSGCEGGSKSASGPESSNTTYVNNITGIDQSGYGQSRDKPYKTITYALEQDSTKNTVEIANGLYDAANGEQFPIVVRSEKKLRGESLDSEVGNFALINGSGVFNSASVNGVSTVAVVFDDGSEISNLVISSEGGVALWCENAKKGTEIINNGLVNSEVGLTFVGDSTALLKGNEITGNQQSGIEVFGTAEPVFLNNIISMNSVGVLIDDNANPGFGGLTGGGGNVITGNSLCDLLHSGAKTISTIGTRWDIDVFDFSVTSSCIAGNEIVVNGTGAVDFQFVPPEDLLLFQNKSRIRLDHPGFGEVLFSREPNFVWLGSNAVITMMAIWEQPPTVGINGISDTHSMYWVWHSGLSTGGSGFVQFSDGVSIINGDLNNTTSPNLLEVGRSYYWAVWGWDEHGSEITASSSLGYFMVSN